MRYDVRRGIRAPLLLVAALGLLAAACSSGSGNGSSSSSGGPETSTITLGSLPVVDAAPAYIADKAGYFKQEGLTVKFQQAQGGAALIPSLVSGDIQIAFSNWVSLFLAKSQGIDLTLIADGDTARPGFSGVFVMPNSPIKTPADLAGKKVAVNTLNNVGGLVISAVLKSKGVDPKSIRFVEVGFPDMGATLQRGQVDPERQADHRPVLRPNGRAAGWRLRGHQAVRRQEPQDGRRLRARARQGGGRRQRRPQHSQLGRADLHQDQRGGGLQGDPADLQLHPQRPGAATGRRPDAAVREPDPAPG